MTASGTANLTANYGTGNNADGTPNGFYMAVSAPNGVPDGTFAGRLDFSSSGTLKLGGNVYTVVHSLADLVALTTADYNAHGGTVVGHYALGSDLDAVGTGYAASPTNSNQTTTNIANLGYAVIGDLSGSLNGLGHSVKNLAIYDTTAAGVGDALVTSSESGSLISNIGVANLNVLSSGPFHRGNFGAGIVAFNGGPVTNVFATGVIAGDGEIGGITSFNSGLIANAYTNLTITGTQNDIGGVAGSNFGTILNSVANGTVTVNALVRGSSVTLSSDIGGLVGANFATIKGSQSNVAVTTTNSTTAVGGLAGLNFATVTNSSATGNVTVTVTNTGLTASGVGGLVGDNAGGVITNSSASGNVLASTVGRTLGTFLSDVGGLVGTNELSLSGTGGIINNSVATGSVTGLGPATFTVGGLVGNNAEGTVTNSGAFGRVSNGTSFVGGLVGADSFGDGVYSNNTFNPSLAGQPKAVGGNFSTPGISATTATGPSAGQGAPPPPTSPVQTAATARATAQTLAQQAAAQQVTVRQAQIGAGVANVSANISTAKTAAAGADTSAAGAGTDSINSTARLIDSNIQYEGTPSSEDERSLRRRTASTRQVSRRVNNLGATIRTIEINGRIFRLRGGPNNSNPTTQP